MKSKYERKKMKDCLLVIFVLMCFFTVTIMVNGCFAYNSNDDIIIANFDSDNYQGWAVTGDAFGSKPAQGTLPAQNEVFGFEGKGLVNSYLDMDSSIGTLVSPEFIIERKHINFLIGGGRHQGETCMNLVVGDGEIIRTATGNNSEKLEWSSWDVSALIGKRAVIQIVDSVKGGWGHINVDSIFQSNENILEHIGIEVVVTKKYLNFPVKTGAAKKKH